MFVRLIDQKSNHSIVIKTMVNIKNKNDLNFLHKLKKRKLIKVLLYKINYNIYLKIAKQNKKFN